MAFDYNTLIIDRAASDSDALKALVKKPMSQWTAAEAEAFTAATLKGSYDYTDLNRVSACMEDLVARLNGLGYQVPGYGRVKIQRTVKPDGVAKLRYLRLTVTALRGNSNTVQLSEIRLLSKTGSVMEWPQGTTVTASINATGEGESPEKLIDGSTETKFCSTQFASGMQINIDLGDKVLDQTEYTSWQWLTANDSPERDPVTFELSGSTDGQTFTTMDSASNADIPETRKSLAYSGSIGILPNGYTELEYIQSSGTQYVDTEFNPDQDTRVVMDLLYTGNENLCNEFGAWNSSGSGAFICLTTGKNNLYPFYGNMSKQVSVDRTMRHIVDMDKNVVKMNNNTMITFSTTTFTCAYPLFLCCFNNGGLTENMTSLRIYFCQIYDNNAFARDYIPCKNAAGEAGLYDLITQAFFDNAGTGNFTAGAAVTGEVVTPSESDTEELDPYLWYAEDAPTQPQIEQYRGNVAAVRAVLAMPDTVPEAPETLRKPHTYDANNIEAILIAIDQILTHIPAARRHCGVTVCGLKGVIA